MTYKYTVKERQNKKKYYQNNRKRIIQNKKKYYQKNKERILQNKKGYYQENKERLQKRMQLYGKKWYQKNKKKIQLRHREYYQKNKREVQQYLKKRYQKNKKRLLQQSRNYYQKNRERVQQRHRNYNQENKEKILRYKEKWHKYRIRTNSRFRLDENMGTAVWTSLKDRKAGRKWETLVSYTLEDLIEHLEKQFSNKMTWDNYGSYWAIDHVKPKGLFNYTSSDDPEFKQCWTLENLQPLEKIKNIKKSNLYIR